MARIAQLVGAAAVLAMVLTAPWVFGGVEARSQVWFFGAALMALACSVIVILSRQTGSIRLPWSFLPLVLAIALGGAQLIPLDSDLRSFLSPEAVALTDSLSGGADGDIESWAADLGVPPLKERHPLSLYPASTRHDLALLILAVSVFFLGAVFFGSPKTHIWLCGLVVANGVAITFFGLTQQLSWNGLLYWSIPLTQGGLPFGPFVNRNNAGGYLLLCFAASVGATTWCLQRYLPNRHLRGLGKRQGVRGLWSFIKRRSIEIIAELNARTLAVLTATGFLAAGIFSTLSRGASVAVVGATLIAMTAVGSSRRRSMSFGWLVVVFVLGVALISWTGLSGAVEGRMRTLFSDEIQVHAVIPHWQDGMEAALDFLPLGSGLGTYRFVYPQYQQQLQPKWFYHAENQYLEAFVEGGVLGLGCLLGVLLLVVAATWRILRWDPDPRSAAFAVAGTLAIAGQVIAACFDFGLYIPANVFLFAVFCGALAGRATCVTKTGDEIGTPSSRAQRLVAILVAGGLFGAGVWGLFELRIASKIEPVLKDIRVAGVLGEYSPSAIEPHIAELGRVAQLQPDNAEVQRRLAELWIQLYRAHTFEQVRVRTALAEDDPRLVQLTLPMVIHQRIHFLKRLGLADELARVRAGKAAQENLIPALKYLLSSRDACPLLPEVHNGMAQLCGLVSDPASDRVYIERIQALASADPDLMYTCGLLQQHAGRFDQARACWKRSLSLSLRHLSNVLDLADPWLTDPDTIEQLLPDSPALLVDLARKQFAGEDRHQVRELLIERATDLVEQVDLPEAERFQLRGAVGALNGDFPKAFESYAQAVRRRPETVTWRYEYAQLLCQEGQWEEARRQAVWCTRLAPEEKKFRRLLEEIHKRRFTRQEL